MYSRNAMICRSLDCCPPSMICIIGTVAPVSITVSLGNLLARSACFFVEQQREVGSVIDQSIIQVIDHHSRQQMLWEFIVDFLC